MTEPSQYFKGRTVQEQMNEVIGYVDVRSAEVATDAIAADVAQVHQDMLDADADASAAAASAAAAAGTLANAVKKTGEASQSIAGDIAVAGDLSAGGDLAVTGDISGGSVTVPTPVNNTDAASKKYVDDQDALDVKLAGNQTVAGVKTFSSSPVVPTVATGTADTKAANGTKVKNELDAYSPMVRTTGNQSITGVKTFLTDTSHGDSSNPDSSSLILWSSGAYRRFRMRSSTDDYTTTPASNVVYGILNFSDANDQATCNIVLTHKSTGGYKLEAILRKQDGNFQTFVLGETS